MKAKAPDLYEGFEDMATFKSKFREYCYIKCIPHRLEVNKPKAFKAVCPDNPNCRFVVRAYYKKEGKAITPTKTSCLQHSDNCHPPYKSTPVETLKAIYSKQNYLYKNLTPGVIKRYSQTLYEVELSYTTSHKVLKEIRNDNDHMIEEYFMFIDSYLSLYKGTNPASIYNLQINKDIIGIFHS